MPNYERLLELPIGRELDEAVAWLDAWIPPGNPHYHGTYKEVTLLIGWDGEIWICPQSYSSDVDAIMASFVLVPSRYAVLQNDTGWALLDTLTGECQARSNTGQDALDLTRLWIHAARLGLFVPPGIEAEPNRQSDSPALPKDIEE